MRGLATQQQLNGDACTARVWLNVISAAKRVFRHHFMDEWG